MTHNHPSSLAFVCSWYLAFTFTTSLHQGPYPSQRSIIKGAKENTFPETSETKDTEKSFQTMPNFPFCRCSFHFLVALSATWVNKHESWIFVGLGTTAGSKLIYHDLQVPKAASFRSAVFSSRTVWKRLEWNSVRHLHFIHLQWNVNENHALRMTSIPLSCSQAALLSGCPCKSTIWNLCFKHSSNSELCYLVVVHVYYILAESATCGEKNSPLCMDTNRSGKKQAIRFIRSTTVTGLEVLKPAVRPSRYLLFLSSYQLRDLKQNWTPNLRIQQFLHDICNTYEYHLWMENICANDISPDLQFWIEQDNVSVMCSAKRLRRPTPCR